MPYPSLVSARRIHYGIDGSVVGWNASGSSNGLVTLLTSTQMLQLNEETPSVDVNVIQSSGTVWTYILFPELVDISYFMCRQNSSGSGTGGVFDSISTSVDTTNGGDGTWLTPTQGSGTIFAQAQPNDWWRSTSPKALTTNNTGLKGIRFSQHNSTDNPFNIRSVYLWGTKTSGQTPDDIIFLTSGGTTEWTTDDDYGDIAAGSAAVTHTMYVKNTSATKTANTITVKSSGSDNTKWTVSLDNASFASSKSIASLAAGATQVVYVKFTPPSLAGGAARPYAAYLEADVTSWT